MADLGHPQGHEQAQVRPVLILQVDPLNYLPTVVVVPLQASLSRGELPLL
jgi:mRNA-degrading endonuclease toxin of MazEF toxin-antitoxin module